MTLPAELVIILYWLVLFGRRIEIGENGWVVRIVAGSTGNVGPFRSMIHRGLRRKLSAGRGIEVSRSLDFTHAPVCQDASWSMTGDAVFGALRHSIGSLSAERRAVHTSHTCLSRTVFAGDPGIISLIVPAGYKQAAVTLTAYFIAIFQ